MTDATQPDWDPRAESVLQNQRQAYDKMRQSCPVALAPKQPAVHRPTAVACHATFHPNETCPYSVDEHRAKYLSRHESTLSFGYHACWQIDKRNAAVPNQIPEQHALMRCLAQLAYPVHKVL